MLLIARLESTAKSLTTGWTYKSVGAALVSIFTHNVQFVILLAILMLFDLLTGMWKVIKTGEFTWSEFGRGTVDKIAVYAIVLVTANGIAQTYTMLSWLGQFVYGFLTLAEGGSIWENLLVIQGKEDSVLSNLIDAIHNTLKKNNPLYSKSLDQNEPNNKGSN